MNYSKIIWLIDGRHELDKNVLNKIIVLKSMLSCRIDIVYDKRLRALERGFWHIDSSKKKLDDEWTIMAEKRIGAITKTLTRLNIEHSISLVSNTDYRKVLIESFAEQENSLLIIQDESLSSRHSVFQELSTLSTSTLILKKNKWSDTPTFLCAVDPLHENARPHDLDEKIVEVTKTLAKHSRANWFLAHSCYLNASFLKYKRQFESIHREKLSEFAHSVGVSEGKTVLLSGQPEHSLPKWVNNRRCDVLIMGIVARNKLMSHLVGSTTFPILNNPPCDLLLVK